MGWGGGGEGEREMRDKIRHIILWRNPWGAEKGVINAAQGSLRKPWRRKRIELGKKNWQRFDMQRGEKGASQEGTASSGTQSCQQVNCWGMLRRRLDWRMNREAGSKAGKASRAKQNLRPCCDLRTESKLFGRLRSFVFGRELNILRNKAVLAVITLGPVASKNFLFVTQCVPFTDRDTEL